MPSLGGGGARAIAPSFSQGFPSVGASEQAVLAVWTPVPDRLDLLDAAALPMAIETACDKQTLLVHGAGTVIGFAAVQMALMRGARVRELAAGAPGLVFDAVPISDVLPDLVRITGGDAARVLTVSSHGPETEKLGVHGSFESGLRYDALSAFAELAAEGRFTVPVARRFPLESWREEMDVGLHGHAHGTLVLLPDQGRSCSFSSGYQLQVVQIGQQVRPRRPPVEPIARPRAWRGQVRRGERGHPAGTLLRLPP